MHREPGLFSLRWGINSAWQTHSKGSSARAGFVGGAELEYQATDIFSISGGVLYSMQGQKDDPATVKTDYINIPILANVYVVKGLAVKLGVQPGFCVNSKTKANGVSYDNNAKTFDFSIPVGVSYEFSKVPIVLDARYNWGLTKVWDNGIGGQDAPRNSVLQFTVGYKFEL